MNERLYRSRDDRIIAGVAGGVAERFRMDPSLVRIVWVILIPVTAGAALALYVVMAFVVPEEPPGDSRWSAWGQQSGGYQWPDPATPGSGAAEHWIITGHDDAGGPRRRRPRRRARPARRGMPAAGARGRARLQAEPSGAGEQAVAAIGGPSPRRGYAAGLPTPG